MIIRIFRVRVVLGREQDWQERVERLSVPWLKSLPGLVAYYPGRPTLGDGERTFTMVTLFESTAALQAAIGEAWREPVLLGDEAALVEFATVEHFEQFG
jgi:Antibiotic biosynthesis monooxygenase